MDNRSPWNRHDVDEGPCECGAWHHKPSIINEKIFPSCTVGEVIEFLKTLPSDALFQSRDCTGDWTYAGISISHIEKTVYIESNHGGEW
jgi:hypothetical protein